MDDSGAAFSNYARVTTRQAGVADWEVLASGGLTKREYFAAMAMQAMMRDVVWNANEAEFAKEAYAMADAMLLEGGK